MSTDYRLKVSNCLIVAIAIWRHGDNSYRIPSQKTFLTSCHTYADRFRVRLTAWDLNFARKARRSPDWALNTLNETERIVMMQYLRAFPRRATSTGQISALDFTRLTIADLGASCCVVHLSVLLDLFSRRIRGFLVHWGKYPNSIDTVKWLKTVKGGRLRAVRTDHGSIYTSHCFKAGLNAAGASHDLIPVGAPWFNGHIESLMKTLKRILRKRSISFRNQAELEAEIHKVVEIYRSSWHSSLRSTL